MSKKETWSTWLLVAVVAGIVQAFFIHTNLWALFVAICLISFGGFIASINWSE